MEESVNEALPYHVHVNGSCALQLNLALRSHIGLIPDVFLHHLRILIVPILPFIDKVNR